MRRLIYGPFQPVCFKRDLAYTLTLTRFFTGPFYHALLLKYTRFHSHAMLCIGMWRCVMPHMYMFITLVSFRCWGAGVGREGVRWTQHACIYMHCVFMHQLWRSDVAAQSVCDVLKKCVCARHFRLIQINFMNQWMFAKCSKKNCVDSSKRCKMIHMTSCISNLCISVRYFGLIHSTWCICEW